MKKENRKRFGNVLGMIFLVLLVILGTWSKVDSDNSRKVNFHNKYDDNPVGLIIDKMQLDFDSATRQQIINFVEDKNKHVVTYDTIIGGNRVVVKLNSMVDILPNSNVKKLKHFPTY